MGAEPVEELIDGIRYRWLPRRPTKAMASAPAQYRTFLRQVWLDAARLARELRPEALIASSTYPMDIWVARRIARSRRPSWSMGARPLAAVADRAVGHVAPPPFAMLCQKAENDAYRDRPRAHAAQVQVCT